MTDVAGPFPAAAANTPGTNGKASVTEAGPTRTLTNHRGPSPRGPVYVYVYVYDPAPAAGRGGAGRADYRLTSAPSPAHLPGRYAPILVPDALMPPPTLELRLPDWTTPYVEEAGAFDTDVERMRFVIRLADENVQRGTGGPFAAAIFETGSGAVLDIGVNLVPSAQLSILHAEVVAILLAQLRLGSYTLGGPDGPGYDLVTSCEPCAMCLGAVLWSGARRLVCGATRADAQAIGFDEGPVTDASYDYLTRRGIDVVRGVERAAARAVLTTYAARNGVIYNG